MNRRKIRAPREEMEVLRQKTSGMKMRKTMTGKKPPAINGGKRGWNKSEGRKIDQLWQLVRRQAFFPVQIPFKQCYTSPAKGEPPRSSESLVGEPVYPSRTRRPLTHLRSFTRNGHAVGWPKLAVFLSTRLTACDLCFNYRSTRGRYLPSEREVHFLC
jgi:hypothetical protein